MASGSAMRWVLFGGTGMRSWVGEIGTAVLRVFAGVSLALAHGWGKLPPSGGFIGGVEAMGFPAPTLFAWLAALSEFGGGLLLAVGLLTRWAALFILGTMLVAAFGMHVGMRGDPYTGYELPLLFAATAFMFLLAGSGRLSVDSMLR